MKNQFDRFYSNRGCSLGPVSRYIPWFGHHDEVDTGIITAQFPWQQMPQILEHVLGEKRSEGSHHPRHGIEYRK